MLNPALDKLTDYPFERLRALLAGIDPAPDLTPLNLSIGEPHHAPPALLAETLAAADGWGRYPPPRGTAEWGAAVADWLTRRYRLAPGAVAAERHVLPLAGTREGLYLAASLVVPPAGDGAANPVVLLPNPFYQVYIGAAVMAGAEPVYLPAGAATGFLPDLDAVDEATWRRAAAFYLCSPANPQGSVADLDYLTRALALCRRHDVVMMADECYAEIYDAAPPPGALEACVALGNGFDNVLVFHSLSKRSSAPGLRSGFVAGDERLIARFARLRSYAGATLGLPIQAASAALWRDEDHVAESRALYRAKIDLAERVLDGRFGFRRPPGGFFLWLDVGDGEEAARTLWRETALRVLPGHYLARPNAAGRDPGKAYIRVALVDDLATTEEALNRLLRTLG
jgi:succinyldiaminopimelate transaminase